jgi:type IV secretory pathway TrbF-like protein
MSRQAQPLLALSLTATGIIAEYRFVSTTVTQAGAAANTLGVARMAAAVGDVIPVDTVGTAIVESGAAIAAGALVETDASGRAITKAAGPSVARVLPGQAATALGQFIEVLLIPN